MKKEEFFFPFLKFNLPYLINHFTSLSCFAIYFCLFQSFLLPISSVHALIKFVKLFWRFDILAKITQRHEFRIFFFHFSSVSPRHAILFALYSLFMCLHFIPSMYPLIIGGKYLKKGSFVKKEEKNEFFFHSWNSICHILSITSQNPFLFCYLLHLYVVQLLCKFHFNWVKRKIFIFIFANRPLTRFEHNVISWN